MIYEEVLFILPTRDSLQPRWGCYLKYTFTMDVTMVIGFQFLSPASPQPLSHWGEGLNERSLPPLTSGAGDRGGEVGSSGYFSQFTLTDFTSLELAPTYIINSPGSQSYLRSEL